jgi:hypothetical protein
MTHHFRRHSSFHALTTVIAVGAVVGSTLPSPGAAQVLTAPRYGIGYVANAPQALAGVVAHVTIPAFGGIGVFVDAKFDHDTPSGHRFYDPTHTAREVEAFEGIQYSDLDDSWRSFNVGLLRPVTVALTLYGGAGYSVRDRYRFYFDPTEELAPPPGVLWVEAPDEKKTTVNVMFGGFMRASRLIAFQFGFETAPRGLTVGASLAYPGW